MNLYENLQNLRKQNGLSQEELAEKLEVSRQSVSKWESGASYPELEKIIMICDLFHCSMDELVKGQIESQKEEKLEYDSFMNRFGKWISLAIFLILVGVTLLLFIISQAPNKEAISKYAIIGSAVLLLFIVIAVPIFIIFGLQMDEMQKKMKNLSNLYSEQEKQTYHHKFSFVIALTVSIILIGILVLLLLYGCQFYEKDSLFPVFIFMIFVTIAVPLMVNAGILKSKYDMIKYRDCHQSKNEELIGKISAVIMISATILYFILGFVLELWKLNWLVFPIGGMLCGIISVIFHQER